MYMKTAVAAALVAAASAFAPTSVGVAQPRLRSAVCDVSMQMDRRAAAGVILAAPAAAFATGGDSPKQAYFATSPLSSPFGEVYTNQGTALWQELAETEREIYTKIARNTKKQLTDIVGYIQRKDWDRARSALRLYTYETRKAMTRLTNASNDSEAKKLLSKFKKQIEATDFALYKKDETTADALLQQAATSFNSWLEVVGIQV